jgi:hypothetical protein
MTRFQKGDTVEVYDQQRGLWLPATIVLAWKTSTFPEGLIGEVYDVEGEDDLGTFHGRWDQPFVRKYEKKADEAIHE